MAAALSSDRTKLILSVVNPSEDGQELAARISGVKLRGPGTFWQMVAPSVDSTNEPGKEPVVTIKEIAQTEVPATVQIPPISVNVYEFEVENT